MQKYSLMKNTDLQAKTILDLADRCDNPNQFTNFDHAFRASLTVSKDTVLKEEARLKKLRAKGRTKK